MFGGTVFARIDDESWLVSEIEPDEFLSDVLQTAGYILLCAEAFCWIVKGLCYKYGVLIATFFPLTHLKVTVY